MQLFNKINERTTTRIGVGDLVRRRYPIPFSKPYTLGLVTGRDNNGFLEIMWGGCSVEHMWDDYDVELVYEKEAQTGQ
jgi:hypothetical protein